MSRYSKFFRGLRSSPCREVSILANLVARDVRSVTGRNVKLIMVESGSNLWSDSPGAEQTGLLESESESLLPGRTAGEFPIWDPSYNTGKSGTTH